MTPNRLNRYISQMEAHRRRSMTVYSVGEAIRYQRDQYAWANLDPLKYGGSEQEDMGDG